MIKECNSAKIFRESRRCGIVIKSIIANKERQSQKYGIYKKTARQWAA